MAKFTGTFVQAVDYVYKFEVEANTGARASSRRTTRGRYTFLNHAKYSRAN